MQNNTFIPIDVTAVEEDDDGDKAGRPKTRPMKHLGQGKRSKPTAEVEQTMPRKRVMQKSTLVKRPSPKVNI